jgi:putative membrane protein
MTLRWLIASIHLVALALGAGGVLLRAAAMKRARRPADLATVFLGDNLWGVAAVLWLATGLWRAFGDLEKGAAYYLGNPLFHAKLTVFVVIVGLEIRPMVNLLRWRRSLRRGEEIDLSAATALGRISLVQLGLVIGIVFLATAIARGLGMG